MDTAGSHPPGNPDRVLHLTEQTPGSKTPEHLRLTPELLTRICAILRPPILLALYGKDGNAVQTSYAAIKLLCWLDPHGTFPPVLDRIHGSLEEGGTSVHRTTTAIALLSYIATPLLNRQHYPPGAQHLMPLLHAVLPGIDMNDPNKTRWTLLWIIGAVMSVPVVEAGTDAGGKPSWRREGSVVKGPGSPNGNGTSPALSDGSWVMPDVDEDDGVQGSTMAFADWVLGFLNRTSLMVRCFCRRLGCFVPNRPRSFVRWKTFRKDSERAEETPARTRSWPC